MTLSQRTFGTGLLLVGFLACVATGTASARHGSMSLLFLVAVVGLALVVVFQLLGFEALLAWIVLTGLAYPLLSIESTDLPLSFDRVFVAGLASWIVLRPTGRRWTPSARWFGVALLCLTVSYGIRAGLTGTYGNFTVSEANPLREALNSWFDGIVIPVALFFVVAQFAYTRERCRQIAIAMAVAGGLLGAIGVAEQIFGFELATLSGGAVRIDSSIDVVRISGTFSVPETYAMVLLVCLAATVWWAVDRGREVWTWAGVAIFFELAGLGVTLFRAAWLGAILIFVAALGLRPGRGLRLITITLVAGLLTLFAISQLQGSDSVISSRVQNTENISGRFATYEQSLKIFALRPLTGVGVDQFENAQNHVPVTVVGDVRAVTSPHSTFLGLLSEQGVVGFLPLVACLLGAAGLLADLKRRAQARSDILLWSCVVGASLAYLVMSATLTMLPYGPSNAFFAIALGMVAARGNRLMQGEERSA